MHVIHFTLGATDPVQGFEAHGARVVPLADGGGADETYVSCLHLEPGGWILDPPVVRDGVLLLVHGTVDMTALSPRMRLELTPGVGIALHADEHYRLESDTGAILMLVEAEALEPTREGKSTPERIWGQTWPGDADIKRPRTLISIARRIWFRLRHRRLFKLVKMNRSGWQQAEKRENVLAQLFSWRTRN